MLNCSLTLPDSYRYCICLFFLSYHELELVQGEEECQAESAHLQAEVCGRGCRHKGRPGKENAQLISHKFLREKYGGNFFDLLNFKGQKRKNRNFLLNKISLY